MRFRRERPDKRKNLAPFRRCRFFVPMRGMVASRLPVFLFEANRIMIRHLSGTVLHSAPGEVVVSCGGVGYLVRVSTTLSPPSPGSHAEYWTFQRVREDALDLFGFRTRAELELFETLQKVRGLPAKAAQAVIGTLGVDGLQAVLEAEDVAALTAIPGIGKKTAQQLLLELRGKIALDKVGKRKEIRDDVVLALLELGFSEMDAERRARTARKKLGGKAEVEDLLRAALQTGV